MEPPRNAQYGNRPQGQTVPPARPPPPALDPTDEELYIFVKGLENCLVTSEPNMTYEQRKVLGNYLIRRNVLARLEQRGDVSTVPFSSKSIQWHA